MINIDNFLPQSGDPIKYHEPRLKLQIKQLNVITLRKAKSDNINGW